MLDFLPGHREWTIQVQRLVAQAPYGGSDPNECLTAVQRIRPGDWESWVGVWRDLGGRLERVAKAALDGGHACTARDAFFRASAYFRQADFFLPGTDDRKAAFFLDAKRCFLAAARLQRPRIEPIEVAHGEEA